MKNIHTEYSYIAINKEFDFLDCTYIQDGEAVIFSPFTGETLLCETSVTDFISFLISQNGTQSLRQIQQFNPLSSREIIDRLSAMRIILLKE